MHWLIQVNYCDSCLNAPQAQQTCHKLPCNKAKSASYKAGPGYLTFKLLPLPCFWQSTDLIYAFVERKQCPTEGKWKFDGHKQLGAATKPASFVISHKWFCHLPRAGVPSSIRDSWSLKDYFHDEKDRRFNKDMYDI